MSADEIVKMVHEIETEIKNLQFDVEILHKQMVRTERDIQKFKLDILLLEHIADEKYEGGDP